MKQKGICSVCACIEMDACEGGCAWANKAQTLCTACAPLNDEERKAKREDSMGHLAMRLDCLTDEALELKARMRALDFRFSEDLDLAGSTGKEKRRKQKAVP